MTHTYKRSDSDTIIADLNSLVADCPDFRKLERLLTKFNTFEVLGIAEMEIRHSNVLAWLFNPQESHALGDSFLRNWLMLVACDQHGGQGTESPNMALPSPAKINSIKFVSVKVEREKNNIDLLVEIEISSGKRWVLCIENKVNSKQHSNQLTKYRNYVEKTYPETSNNRYYLLLSKNNEQPEGADKEHYIATTYECVLNALEQTLEDKEGRIPNEPIQLIQDYLEVLKVRFSNNKDESIRELAYAIYKKHALALNAIDDLENLKPDEVKQIASLTKESHTTVIDELIKNKPNNRDKIVEYLQLKIEGVDSLQNLPSRRNYFQFRPKRWVPEVSTGANDNKERQYAIFQLEIRQKKPALKLVLVKPPYVLTEHFIEDWKAAGFHCRVKNLKTNPQWLTLETFELGVSLPDIDLLGTKETKRTKEILWERIEKWLNKPQFQRRIELIKGFIEQVSKNEENYFNAN